MKYNFRTDYCEGCHPSILRELERNNISQNEGYGEDIFCIEAKNLIRLKCNQPKADVHFVSGGTQANLVSLSHILRPYESVIASNMSHISVHETGAIEATGHKINTINTIDGKITTDQIQLVLEEHYFEHMVSPKLVFISNTTEIGSVYTKEELITLYDYCHSHNLYLYIDGARLGAALTSENNDMTLADIAKYTDAFYIGGTKNGFLMGEAIVITNNNLKSHFRYQMKQRGALLAKGKLLGIQFSCMFKDNLYFEVAKHTNNMAKLLSKGITDLGYKFLTTPQSNQIFPIFPNEIIKHLSEDYSFYEWCKINDNDTCIRLVTSWACKEENITLFINDLNKIVKKYA